MYLAIKGCEFRFEVFELLFLLPRAVHDLLQNRNILGYLFRVRLKLLNQAVYLLQGVQEVHAGELRVCRNPAVVVAVLHSAFSRHEELVLRKVEKVFGGRLAANELLPFAVQTGNLLFQLCLLQ